MDNMNLDKALEYFKQPGFLQIDCHNRKSLIISVGRMEKALYFCQMAEGFEATKAGEWFWDMRSVLSDLSKEAECRNKSRITV